MAKPILYLIGEGSPEVRWELSQKGFHAFASDDYDLEDNLAFLAAWCDPISNLPDGWNVKLADPLVVGPSTYYYTTYQPKVVAVVLPSAYHRCSNPAECGDPPDCVDCQEFVWLSKGAEQEYAFCKAHHILVIPLETALTVPPERWEANGL